MKAGKYTRISIMVLGFALAAILLAFISYTSGTGFLGGLNAGFLIGLYTAIVLVPISIIVSLVSLIKERTLLSVIIFLISLSPAVVVSATFISESIEDKRNWITEDELLDAYEKISGKKPLCLLDSYNRIYLLSIARIDCDTIGDDDFFLQYETANLGATNYQLKKLNADINDWRNIGVIHYIPYEDDGFYEYKVRYYDRYSYLYEYQKRKKSYNKVFETDDVRYSFDDSQWRDSLSAKEHQLNMLQYYMEHKPEIPVIAEKEITKGKTHVKFKIEAIEGDKYELIFKTLRDYENFPVIVKFLQEYYHAEVSDIKYYSHRHYAYGYRMAPVKIGNSIMELRSVSYVNSLFGSLSDRPLMEQIAEDFEIYAVNNNLVSKE